MDLRKHLPSKRQENKTNYLHVASMVAVTVKNKSGRYLEKQSAHHNNVVVLVLDDKSVAFFFTHHREIWNTFLKMLLILVLTDKNEEKTGMLTQGIQTCVYLGCSPQTESGTGDQRT